jgi:hypothetical protein
MLAARQRRANDPGDAFLTAEELRLALAFASGLAWAVFLAGLAQEFWRDRARRQRDAVAQRLLGQVFPRGIQL